MHPAIQFLFLEAAREINGKESFFAKREEFPSFKDSLLPESPVAMHYEKNRYPLLTNYFPFWLAELINRLLFVLLPFFVLAYPALHALPSFRIRRMYNKINRLYGELKTFEQDLLLNFSEIKRDEYLKKLDLLEYQALNIQVSKRLAEAPGTQTAISAPAAAVGQYVTEATGSPLAGMLAGGATGGVAGIRGRKAESAPTAAQLKDQASLAYKKSAEAGAVIKPESLEAAGNRIVNNVTSKIIIDPEVDTGAMAIIRRLQKTFDEPQTLEQLDLTRQFIRDEQAGGGRNSKFARESLKGFDDYIDSIGKKDIVAGDSAQAIGSLKTARDLWKRSNKTQIVEDLLESAELRSGNYSQSGIENSLRQRLVKLADSEDMKFFTIGEQEAIKAAAKGGKVQNVLKWMGKLSPSSVIAAGAGSYIGASMFGPAGAVIAPAVGFASKQAATKMRLNAVQNLQDMIALGRMPEADARARLVPITGLRGLLSTANQPK
jgi:hypothetical protein